MTTTSYFTANEIVDINFEDINVYTYLSLDIEYFHGRHLAYVIMAITFKITVVIGLPLLLLLEPSNHCNCLINYNFKEYTKTSIATYYILYVVL